MQPLGGRFLVRFSQFSVVLRNSFENSPKTNQLSFESPPQQKNKGCTYYVPGLRFVFAVVRTGLTGATMLCVHMWVLSGGPPRFARQLAHALDRLLEGMELVVQIGM